MARQAISTAGRQNGRNSGSSSSGSSWHLLPLSLLSISSAGLLAAAASAAAAGGSQEPCASCSEEPSEAGLLQLKATSAQIPEKQEESVLASGIARHPDSACDLEVGAGRLQQYSSMGSDLCGAADDSGASFACAAKWTSNQGGYAKAGDYLCRGSNLQLFLKKGQPVGIYGSGSGCQWKLQRNGLQLSYFLFDDGSLAPLELYSGGAHRTCTEDVGSTTLLLYSEKDYWNPYLNQAQAIMAYISSTAVGLDLSKTRVVFTNPTSELGGAGKLNMISLVEKLFSRGGDSLSATDQEKLICAKDVVIPNGGRASFVRKTSDLDPWAAKCRDAPLLHSYGSFFLNTFGVTPRAPSVAKERIVILVRKPNKVHPNPYHRSLTNADDVQQALQGDDNIVLDKGALSLLATLKPAILQQRASSSAVGADDVEVVESSPELLSIAEQAELFANADLVISAHSAALSWMVVMPKCSQVLEFCANNLYQFFNYAELAGLDHTCLSGGGEWGTNAFTANVKEVMDKVEAASQRRAQCMQKLQK